MSQKNFVAIAARDGADALPDAIEDLDRQLAGRAPVLVCAFAGVRYALDVLQAALESRWSNAQVLSCSSAGEFTPRVDATGSLVLWALAGDFVAHSGFSRDLADDPHGAVAHAIAELPDSVAGHPHRMGLMLLDPFSGRGEEATLLAATLLDRGDPVRLVGGAAGDELAMTRTEVGAAGQVATDAIAIAMLYSVRPLGLGVRHGHSAFSDPITVTRADGNVVYELDGRPAWDVWVERTRTEARTRGIDVDNLPLEDITAFLLTYQGSLAAGQEIKVRSPLGRGDDGSLSFATAIPTGASIRITRGDPDGQIESARQAAADARAQLGEHPPAGALVFDCICRKLILQDRFAIAVRDMSEVLDGAPVGGFETYGEIALDAGDLSGFHNTTTVVLAVPE